MLQRNWLHELTRPAFEEWLESDPSSVVIIGLGSLEQHGPHLPIGTDSLTIREFIHEVAKRSNSVCVHPCFPGYSPHHMDFRGTVTFSEGTLIAVIMDTVGSLARHGIKRFLLMNGHGGNTNIVNLAVQLAKREFKVMVASPDGPSDTELARVRSARQKRHWDVHSGVNETGTALYLFPDLVEMKRLEGWEPTLDMDPEVMEFLNPDRKDFELVSQIFRACAEPDTLDFTQSGVYGTNDPREADTKEAADRFEERVAFAVEFINRWKAVPLPPAYQD